MLVFCNTPVEGEELFLMTKFKVLNNWGVAKNKRYI